MSAPCIGRHGSPGSHRHAACGGSRGHASHPPPTQARAQHVPSCTVLEMHRCTSPGPAAGSQDFSNIVAGLRSAQGGSITGAAANKCRLRWHRAGDVVSGAGGNVGGCISTVPALCWLPDHARLSMCAIAPFRAWILRPVLERSHIKIRLESDQAEPAHQGQPPSCPSRSKRGPSAASPLFAVLEAGSCPGEGAAAPAARSQSGHLWPDRHNPAAGFAHRQPLSGHSIHTICFFHRTSAGTDTVVHKRLLQRRLPLALRCSCSAWRSQQALPVLQRRSARPVRFAAERTVAPQELAVGAGWAHALAPPPALLHSRCQC
jgi:hypothetical protein